MQYYQYGHKPLGFDVNIHGLNTRELGMTKN